MGAFPSLVSRAATPLLGALGDRGLSPSPLVRFSVLLRILRNTDHSSGSSRISFPPPEICISRNTVELWNIRTVGYSELLFCADDAAGWKRRREEVSVFLSEEVECFSKLWRTERDPFSLCVVSGRQTVRIFPVVFFCSKWNDSYLNFVPIRLHCG